MRIVASTPEEAAEKFAVEMSRFIARIEGLPEGGTPASAMGAVRQIRRSVDAEATAALERMEQIDPSDPALMDLLDQFLRVRAVGAKLDDMYPEAAYGALEGTQAGAAVGRRLRMTEAERQARPFQEDMASAAPPEGTFTTESGPARQFGADGQEPPTRWLERDLSAPLSVDVRQWTGLHGLPLRVHLKHILSARRKKDKPGLYGPDGDLHTEAQVHTHMERVLSGPDFAWMSANRDGTFSMNLAKMEEKFVRVVPVSLSIPKNEEGLVATVFNQRLDKAA
jgi:hypothetical protein